MKKASDSSEAGSRASQQISPRTTLTRTWSCFSLGRTTLQWATLATLLAATLLALMPGILHAQQATLTHETPELVDTTGEQWLEPIAEQGRRRRRSHMPGNYGVMSDWDLYAGSVYANTSPLWIHTEALLWWMRGNKLPALVTTSSAGTPRSEAGVLGAANTSVLLGDERIDDRARGGFRTAAGVRLGHWFDHLMDAELQFDLLWVGDGQSGGDFQGISVGDPILARPFYDAALNAQDAQLVAFPNVVWGDISVQTSSDFLSAGALYHKGWRCYDNARIDWLAGYRYAQLRDELLIEERLVSVDPGGAVAVGTTFDLFDDFRTWNEFHGADLGLQLWTHMHGWTIEVIGKVALGKTLRTLEVNGETFTLSPAGGASVAPGGLLAMPTNMGRHQSNQFAALPELTIRLRRPISRFFTFTAGYTAMALSGVVRTGDQIDLAVNPTQFGNGTLIGAPYPAVRMDDSTVWLQGVSVGLEW